LLISLAFLSFSSIPHPSLLFSFFLCFPDYTGFLDFVTCSENVYTAEEGVRIVCRDSSQWQNYKKSTSSVSVPEFLVYLILGLPFWVVSFAVGEASEIQRAYDMTLSAKLSSGVACRAPDGTEGSSNNTVF
jgi:hypothetical protein